MTRRLFVGAWLSDLARNEVAGILEGLRARETQVRWVPPGNLHATLAFLGDVDEERLDDLVDRIARSLDGTEAFALRLAGLGAFPKRGDVRVVWVGIHEGARELESLASRLERTLVAGGYLPPSDRPFAAHVTLGRPKGARGSGRLRELLESLHFDGSEQRLEEVTLAESRLTPRGAQYEAIARVRLGTKAGVSRTTQGGEGT
ncbi:MAG: RNA 2',3'-cyclic phosphodiesterase [bacterium]